jgi:manganese efflux pump family protein
MNKLKEKWGIKNNSQLIIILFVFTIAGSSSAYVTTPILSYFSVTQDSMHFLAYYFLKVLIVFPSYLVLLTFFGFVSGQFQFFWKFEKQMLASLGLGFLFN